MFTTQRDQITQLRVFGLIGVAAAATMLASDCVMMDSSSSGADFTRVAVERLTNAPNWRLTLGGVGGPIGACLFVIGSAHLYIALREGGRRLAFLCAACLATGYIILGAWHAAGPMFAFVNRMQPGVANPLAHESWSYLMTLGFVGFLPAAAALVLLPLLILFRKSLYPRWFALLTPGVLYVGASFSFVHVPAPLGGYLVMGSGSLCSLLFFVCSTTLLWNPQSLEQNSGASD